VKLKLIFLLLLPLFINGCSSDTLDSVPEPTKTIYVPAPQPGLDLDFQDELNSNLEEIKQTNCRLATDLLFQSQEIEQQAFDLERQSGSLDRSTDLYSRTRNQAQQLREQALNLLVKSSQLRQYC
jgi:PBP1b-binding outer membrane lipoprotein LpoB